jgi:hypothetical protein
MQNLATARSPRGTVQRMGAKGYVAGAHATIGEVGLASGGIDWHRRSCPDGSCRHSLHGLHTQWQWQSGSSGMQEARCARSGPDLLVGGQAADPHAKCSGVVCFDSKKTTESLCVRYALQRGLGFGGQPRLRHPVGQRAQQRSRLLRADHFEYLQTSELPKIVG